ncbi:glycosyltransferase, partial [candidate division FCPU426 bacterium]|nr:glycosyltransferase [candidate division FCPU426 bacterium]
GRLIFPDGRMQEAGSIIWKDGSCLGYGREANPYQPEFNFFRDVDYCSGALVMTPKTLFNRLGTFDERYAPAYYEEADYCMQIRAAGLRVVYQPLAYVFHHEFGSATKDWAVQMQKTNQKKFVQKWGKHLSEHWDPVGENILPAREGVRARANILFIDDRIPNPMLGSGYPRAFDMLMMLRELGYRVTFWPLQVAQKEIGFTRKLQEKGVEVFYGPENTKLDLQKHLAERRGFYQVVLISRPHNMAEAAAIIRAEDPDLRLIYDAEAIFALREILFSEVIQGKPLSDKAKLSKITKEMKLAKPADCVLTVSEYERTQFEKHAIPRARVLGFLLKADPTPALYAERRDLLFVGGILASPSPNEDAVLYFLNEIFPHIQKQNACKVTIAGTNKSREIWQRHSESVRITGQVEDLYAYYNAHRVFVVPTRYAAGIPLKLFEAASHGIPAVVTPLIARQVGWKDGQDYLVGHNAGEFAEHVLRLYADGQLFNTLRRNALLRVEQECSRQVFRRQMQEAVEGVLLPPGKDGALPG